MAPLPGPETHRLMAQIARQWRAIVTERLAVPSGIGSLSSTGILTTSVLMATGQIEIAPPFDRYPLREHLEALRAADRHIGLACANDWQLARALELLGFDQVSPQVMREHFAGDRFEETITEHLIGELFASDYTRAVYFRLYNAEFARVPLQLTELHALTPSEVSIRELDPHRIPVITGESTFYSTLHREGTGNCFLVFTDQAAGDDIEWWRRHWTLAHGVVRTLQYLKYGILALDYSVIHYTPEWVNPIRRYGVSLWGNPRGEVQASRYRLEGPDEILFQRILRAVIRFDAALQNLTHSLRRATQLAGSYYEGHHRRSEATDQLIDLVVALEALFSPTDQRELSFRVALNAAILLAPSRADAQEMATFIREMYDARSSLVHGGENPFLARRRPVTPEHLRRLGELVREAISRATVLYVRGTYHGRRELFLAALNDALFQDAVRDELRSASDELRFLDEHGL